MRSCQTSPRRQTVKRMSLTVQAALISYQLKVSKVTYGGLSLAPPNRLQHRFSFGRPEQDDKIRVLVGRYSESPKWLGVGSDDFCTPRNVVLVRIRIVDSEV